MRQDQPQYHPLHCLVHSLFYAEPQPPLDHDMTTSLSDRRPGNILSHGIDVLVISNRPRKPFFLFFFLNICIDIDIHQIITTRTLILTNTSIKFHISTTKFYFKLFITHISRS